MDNIPVYQGKLTVYLDHNILDMFVKNGLGELGKMISNEYQVVYSNENLKEIKRSTGCEENFLNVLNQLNALHLNVCLDDQFQPTGNATVSKKDSYDAFNEFSSNDPIFDLILDTSLLDLQKMYGGISDSTFEDIKDKKNIAYDQLYDFLFKKIEELKTVLPPDFDNQLKKLITAMQPQMTSSIEEISKFSMNNIKEPIGWSGIKEYRNFMNIGPKELNNIEPPNVIQQIWDICKVNLPQEVDMTIEQFFGIDSNPIYPSADFFNYQKVNAVYTILNMLGYYPDSKVHKDRRFIASMSDQSHASIATFADILLSQDKPFMKKVQAAYEFLDINTNAILIETRNHRE